MIKNRPQKELCHKMYMCLCNPFSDKDVRKALDNPDIKNTPAQIYKRCSGGQSPGCGTCLCAIKDMIVDHQATLGLQKLKNDLPSFEAAE